MSLRFWTENRLVGLAVKVSTLRAENPGFESYQWQDFSRSSHTSDLKISKLVATLPGAWHYRVSAGTGQPGVSMLWLGEIESLICNFYLSVAAHKISVAAHKIVCADLSLRYTHMLLEHSATNQQTIKLKLRKKVDKGKSIKIQIWNLPYVYNMVNIYTFQPTAVISITQWIQIKAQLFIYKSKHLTCLMTWTCTRSLSYYYVKNESTFRKP